MDFVSKQFEINNDSPCIIIGEIGINHNNDRELLFRLIDEGVNAGVDIIKFQRFNSSLEISQYAPTADYQKASGFGESQLNMAKQYELPDEWLYQAYEYCRKKGVGFLCTAFEHESVDFIADKLECKSVKVSSADINNKPLLDHMSKKFDSIIFSSGASYMDECKNAVTWLLEGGVSRNNLSLMHCTSQYPASLEQANLKCILSLQNELNIPIGYSDHTEGVMAGIVSASLGAVMIEKHFTLDKNMKGPDHKASADIDELRLLVKSVREVSSALGDGLKKPAAEEAETRDKIRKSVVCGIKRINEGSTLEPHMVEVKRPYVEHAIQPEQLEKIIGSVLLNDLEFDQPILHNDLNQK